MNGSMIKNAMTCLMLLGVGAAHATAAIACDDTASGSRFTPERSAGLIDETTGLVWQACLAGQSMNGGTCMGEPLHLSWNDADAAAAALDGAWRLPTLEELDMLIDPSCENGVLPAVFGMDRKHQIWTASPGFPVNDVAAVMDLETGKVWGVGKGVKRHFFLVSDDPR